jgi:hypothetical protein
MLNFQDQITTMQHTEAFKLALAKASMIMAHYCTLMSQYITLLIPVSPPFSRNTTLFYSLAHFPPKLVFSFSPYSIYVSSEAVLWIIVALLSAIVAIQLLCIALWIVWKTLRSILAIARVILLTLDLALGMLLSFVWNLSVFMARASEAGIAFLQDSGEVGKSILSIIALGTMILLGIAMSQFLQACRDVSTGNTAIVLQVITLLLGVAVLIAMFTLGVFVAWCVFRLLRAIVMRLSSVSRADADVSDAESVEEMQEDDVSLYRPFHCPKLRRE